MAFRILFCADTHLGYAAKCRNHGSGLNERVVDGYRAFRETVDYAIANEVDLFLHGGDLFHRSWPTVTDIVFARRQLDRLAAAGIPVVGTTGNHDAAAERGKSPATAAVHDPQRGIDFVVDPLRLIEPVPGLTIHGLSHYGLARAERIIPEPIDGQVNVLLAHGAARIPDHPVFQCTDSPGEQPIGVDVLHSDWHVSLLGHYHGRGVLPGLGSAGNGEAWYAGSSLRRGFSDPPGDRGALLVEVTPTGHVTVQPVNVWQRPQFDLPAIDGRGLTGTEIREIVEGNLSRVEVNGAIIRQVVNNVTGEHRATLGLSELASATTEALVWQPTLNRAKTDLGVHDNQDNNDETLAGNSLATASASDLPQLWEAWAPDWSVLRDMPDAARETVIGEGRRILQQVQDAAGDISENLHEADEHQPPFPTPDAHVNTSGNGGGQ